MSETLIENVYLVCSTDKAGLYLINGEKHWIPWSQVGDGSIDTDQQHGDLYVSEWIVDKKGLV